MSETCETWDVAVVRHEGNETVWQSTPTRTHVADELAAEPDARAFLETRYEFREPCPIQPGAHHAYLTTTTDPEGA